MDVKLSVILLMCGSFIRPSDAACALDLCSMLSDLCPGKTCLLPEPECVVSCVCDETSTAGDCVNVTSGATTEPTNKMTTNSSVCLCVNGNCTDSGECDCENGWSGDLCEFECDLDCEEGFRCQIIQSPFRFAICASIVSTTTLEPSTTSPSLEPGVKVYNVCSDEYTLRPLSERMCSGGWTCVRGVCRSNGTRNWCECDPGATGQVCQDICCKPCQNGTCFYNILDKEPMCNCDDNYSGSFCEIWDPPSKY